MRKTIINSADALLSLTTMFRTFFKIGILSFGGPAAQISLMHKLIVDEKKWLSEQQFLNALSFCMLLPGPEAMQLATYAGWKLRGTLGGLISGLLFVLPGAFIILGLSILYVYFGKLPIIETMFLGVKAAVLIIVFEALFKISKRALLGAKYWAIALLSFIGIFFFAVPFPIIILIAAIIGYLLTDKNQKSIPAETTENPIITYKQTLLKIAIWLPILAIHQFFNIPMLNEISLFFSKMAVVTFGGAYAVLAYMGQDVVNHFGWLSAGEMMDSLGLAETTPGPLILVTEFVGFVAAFKQGGIMLGLMAAAITLWVTFIPCFLWIFACAPYIDLLAAQPKLKAALAGITASVVGVILNLSLWFALHVFFNQVSHVKFGILSLWVPDLASLDFLVICLAAICGFLLFKLKWNILKILLMSSILSIVAMAFN